MSNLVKCPECQSVVSALAESCPHCGAPVRNLIVTRAMNKKYAKPAGNFLITFLFILIGLLVGMPASILLGLGYNTTAGVLGFCIPFFGFLMLGRSIAKKSVRKMEAEMEAEPEIEYIDRD